MKNGSPAPPARGSCYRGRVFAAERLARGGFVHTRAVREAGNSLCASLQGELGRGVCYCGLQVDAFLLFPKRQSLDTGPALAPGQEESCGCEGSHGRIPGLFVFSTNILACLQKGGFPLAFLLLIQPKSPVTKHLVLLPLATETSLSFIYSFIQSFLLPCPLLHQVVKFLFR